MRPPRLLLASLLVTALLPRHPARAQAPPSLAQPFALVELYTAEGCTMCPYVERLLAEVETATSGARVFPVAFHLDTWDHLGWVDRHARAAHAARLRDYARTKAGGEGECPWVVINGRAGYSGIDEPVLRRGIREGLAQSASVRLDGRVRRKGPLYVTLEGQVTATPAPALLHVALVESGLVTKVERGRNAGRTLRHAPVVRVFVSKSLPAGVPGDFAVDLQLPSRLVAGRARVVAWVQDTHYLVALGAAAWPLP